MRLPDSCELREWMTHQNRPEYAGPSPAAETEPTLPASGHNHASIDYTISQYWPESGFQMEMYVKIQTNIYLINNNNKFYPNNISLFAI